MKVLITGITGFAGTHLAALARAEGAEVTGLSRSQGVDLANATAVRRTIGYARPDLLFHLAAQTSGSDGDQLRRSNVEGTIRILEAAAAIDSKPRVVIASSSAIYGAGSRAGAAIGEEAPLSPNGAYAASKAEQDKLAQEAGRTLGLDVIRARAFNQTGPGEKDGFVASSVARQIAEIEAGLREPRIAIGRTDTIRDFSDVRDIVRGYWLAALKGEAGEAYNLCSGRGVSVQTIVDTLLSLTKASIAVEQDPARMRPSDVPVQIGDPSKAKRALGWEADTPLETTLSDLLEGWRRAVRRV